MSVTQGNKARAAHRGFSLLEVVAGLVLMASVLSVVLVSYGRQHRRNRDAQALMLAVDLADNLLLGWTESQQGVPLHDAGVMPGYRGWLWRTQVLRVEQRMGVSLPIVQLEIFSVSGGSANGRAVLTVEVVGRPA